MGRSREIVRDKVLTDLTKAYADEWLAHYQYWLARKWTKGLAANTLKSMYFLLYSIGRIYEKIASYEE